MSDLIERLQGHVETLRGVASGVYSDDIGEAIVEIEQLKHDLERHMAIANDTANENEQLRAAVCALSAGAPSHDLYPEMKLFVGGVVADSQAFQTGGNRNE